MIEASRPTAVPNSRELAGLLRAVRAELYVVASYADDKTINIGLRITARAHARMIERIDAVLARFPSQSQESASAEDSEEELGLRTSHLEVTAPEGEPLEATATFEGSAVRVFASSVLEWFRQNGGDNFVTCELTDPLSRERYDFTVQRVRGKPLAQDLAELRSRTARPALLYRCSHGATSEPCTWCQEGQIPDCPYCHARMAGDHFCGAT